MTYQLPRPLILASSSVYRQQLLSRLRYPFSSVVPNIDETPKVNEPASTLALRLALEKALSVSAHHPRSVVIGSDQVADLNGTLLGKPGTHQRAIEQLTQMSGQTVLFQTAVAVVCQQTHFVQQELATVSVTFKCLSPELIESYLRAEMPYDCAGSAKSEGLGIMLLERIDSDDPTALIGLPLIRTCRLLSLAGIALLGASS